MADVKKPADGEQPTFRIVLPRKHENEMFAIVIKLNGTDQVKAIFQDGVERGCRITGKLKKKVWIREGDLIIAKIWDFQPSKADIVWRYLEPQKNVLYRKGLLTGLPL
ncbi:MAG: translation initiation factor eIF-1A [Candidatus Diapherotrites archaeon]|nr:translation initiation factor eIF-1A [Candidatus Diapherotrites archaeon]